ncbi:MAG: AMP-binding protein [Pseudomonadota bacterium]
MADPDSFPSVYECFRTAAARHPERPFLHVLNETAEAYRIAGGELSYGDMLAAIDARAAAFEMAGYSTGHRIGLLLENRPSFFVNWLALNRLGASVVPINPDLKLVDLAYLIEHSEMSLCIAVEARMPDVQRAIAEAGSKAELIGPDADVPRVASDPSPGNPHEGTEAALLYTSGTTGLPKGCVLTNAYFLHCAGWYARLGGHCRLEPGGERMLTPLPMFHMNAMACSTMAMIQCGGCLIVLDRFHPGTWWHSVAESRATIVHYLGVMPPLLMQAPETPADKIHQVRFGFGAGVDPGLHALFEDRFGFPLIEAWAMTETGLGGCIAASEEPRHVGTRCFGRPEADVDVRVVDDDRQDVSAGTPGELLVRHAGANPRRGFFDRYLKDEKATCEAWTGGWFHTGDVVQQNQDGTFIFVDRKKNVIRRSGENIAAVEVENTLSKHEDIEAAAVAAVPDVVRGDEVFACIVPARPIEPEQREAHAAGLVSWCLEQLAYYKAPGYVSYIQDLPVTATNKIQRAGVRDMAARLHGSGDCIDTRHLKKRTVSG